MAWMSSPRPGAVTTMRTSATSATSMSVWPVPTVSIRMTSRPAASSASITRTAAGVEAAEVAAARQRAHEHAVVVERRRHADAVAQNGAARDRARRVDGDDADRLGLLAQVARVGVEQRRLAGAGRTGDADHDGVPEVGLHGREQAGAAAERRSSSVTAREIARRSPARMRSTSRGRSARSSLSGLGFECAMAASDTGAPAGAQLPPLVRSRRACVSSCRSRKAVGAVRRRHWRVRAIAPGPRARGGG